MIQRKRQVAKNLCKSLNLKWWQDLVRGRRKSSGHGMLGFELLEDRTLLSVVPTLTNGLLDISCDAANDAATVSVVGANIQVSDGTNSTNFTAANVLAINAHGNA